MASTRALVLALLVVGASVGGLVLATASPPGMDSDDPGSGPGTTGTYAPDGDTDLVTADSAAEFESYVRQASRAYGDSGRFGLGDRVVMLADAEMAVETTSDGSVTKQVRHSSTNVQEVGIGEPDLVKTDGRVAYYSPTERFRFQPKDGATGLHVLSVRPPGSVEQIGAIDESGRLLRANDTLVVLGHEAVTGYDVSDPATPEQVWNRSLDGRVTGARLLDGQVYLVVASGLDRQPCPVEPLAGVSTPCTEVLHPSGLVPTETTYTVAKLDAETGVPDATRSIVGPRDSVVYMSEESLYLTLTRPTPRGELMLDFLLESAADELPPESVEHLRAVRGYNLSDGARYAEAQHVLNTWLQSMDEAERKRVNERLAERYRNYTRDRLRELTTTQVVEVRTGDLAVEATGAVPGEPLNQWALDEHEGTLRIATTVRAPRMRWQPANTSNDVYTLDRDLDVAGSVQGMSDGQEVFGVRFVGDTGYVVTFRQVDPLHVLDLSDPTAPTEEGELKLPGFSRYLHPLSEDRLLGIGEEDGRVKTVIFDVSDPTDPTIEHSRVLRAHWSAAVDNHHAFLHDQRHEVFYLPTEFGGQVVSTEDLSTHKRVSIHDPRRAIYVGDSLYVFGQQEVVVLNETTWERTGHVRLSSPET